MNRHLGSTDENRVQQGLQQQPRWGSPNALPTRPRARAQSLNRQGKQRHSGYMTEAAQPSGLDSAASDEQAYHMSISLGIGHPSKPLVSRVSLDTLIGHADRAAPQGSAPFQQPAHFHTSLDELMAQGIIQDSLEAPSPNHAAENQAAGHHRRPSHRELKQLQHSGSAKHPQQLSGGLRISGSAKYNRQVSGQAQRHDSQDWDLDSAKQGGEDESGAAALAARAMTNFASPTRSSEAKMKQRSLNGTPSRSRGSASDVPMSQAQDQGQVGPADGADTGEGTRGAPLTSTFR